VDAVERQRQPVGVGIKLKRLIALIALLVCGSAFAWGWGRGGGLTCPHGFVGGGLTPCTAAPPQYSPYFEFAPVDGGLGTTPCQCVNPTGAKGEALTMARTGVASCLKSDAFASGIAPGDMVWCPTNTARLAYADTTSHQLGLWAERTKTNACLRSTELDDAAWVSVATVTADTTPGLDGGVNADTLTDASALAVEGSTQAITTASLTRFSWSCFVMAGTANSATMSVTGVGDSTGDCSATATSLSTTTYTRIGCNSAAAYAGALSAVGVFVGVGSTVGVTGTLIVTGCQLEVGTLGFPSSFIHTEASAVVRNGDNLSYALPAPYAAPATTVAVGCTRACIRPAYWSVGSTTGQPGSAIYTGSSGRGLYRSNGFGTGTTMLWNDGTSEDGYPTNPTFSASSSACYVSWFAGSARLLTVVGGTATAGAYDGTWGIGVNAVRIGWNDSDGATASQYEAVISQVKFDPTDAGGCY
jgi:hypothetical protein